MQEEFTMANRFVSNAISYHGKGAIQEIPGLVAAKGFKKAFIATDPDLVKFGVTKKVTTFWMPTVWLMKCILTLSPTPPLKMSSPAWLPTRPPALIT